MSVPFSFSTSRIAKAIATGLCTGLLAGTAQASISDDEIRIGYLDDLSGPYSDLAGPGGLEAIRMAVEDFDSKVGDKKIVLFSADHKNNADLGANTAREWLDRRGVDLIAGLNSSAVAITVSRLVEEKNRFAIVSTAAAASLTNEYCTPNHLHYVYDTYSVSNGAANAIVANGGDSWYLLSADYAFGHAMEEQVSKAVAASGGKVIGKARHPFPTSDFSSYILQAQASGAKVIGLASAGSDLVNAISTANQFGLVDAGQTMASLMVFITDIKAIGLPTAQGTQFVSGWYWDMNDASRAWAKRYYERTKRMPTMVQAGMYSSTYQYLKAVEATGSDDPQGIREHMMKTPINDMFTQNGRVRADGRMVHDMYLAQVKTPEESKGEWDLFKILSTIPADEAFLPLSESKCKLVAKN
ncbi:branched-chain amino acid transport system substrate-binding protein [Geopseudomonas sagittaria]|uniref:Branched-chain amino acid transport system substrate-binding protein n=1 Tax=Geopseudomonas sagittaria TaxID=1135990 RepID=A0A1I5RAF9_9GAMM|nr:ABC transporter substrate-binding protein [Pseudomonas sagittaria]SFP55489.1 branched-chain amino acid transport system substrate-binding protein [Pseudomonas sagittaria]